MFTKPDLKNESSICYNDKRVEEWYSLFCNEVIRSIKMRFLIAKLRRLCESMLDESSRTDNAITRNSHRLAELGKRIDEMEKEAQKAWIGMDGAKETREE